jgi:protein-tyrosine phosphatase
VILNATTEIPCHFEENTESDGITPLFNYRRIELADEVHVPISEHFKEAFTFLGEALSNKKRVLVHCQEGISRSSTIVIAFLMYRSHRNGHKPLSLHDAYQWVKSMRKQIFPNLGFWKQLSNFELQLKRDQLIEEARNNGSDENTVPSIDQLKGTLDDCIDVALLTAEYKARKATQLKYLEERAAAASAGGSEEASSTDSGSSSEMTSSQRLAHAVLHSPNKGTLNYVRGVATDDAHERAQEAIVEEGTPFI